MRRIFPVLDIAIFPLFLHETFIARKAICDSYFTIKFPKRFELVRTIKILFKNERFEQLAKIANCCLRDNKKHLQKTRFRRIIAHIQALILNDSLKNPLLHTFLF